MTPTSRFRALSRLINRKSSLLAMYVLALGLMLASPLTPTASAYNRLEIYYDPALTRETDGDGDGIIEPGEYGQIAFRVRNRSLNDVSSTYIRVEESTGYAYVYDYTDSAQWWGSAYEQIIYIDFYLFPELPCGASLDFFLYIEWHVPFHPLANGSDNGSGQLALEMLDHDNANTFSYDGLPVPIPDNSQTGVDIPLYVCCASTITDLDFVIDGSSCSGIADEPSPGLNHAAVHDLVLTLTSPSGTTVTLMDRPGDEVNSGSNFCNTVLDEDVNNPGVQDIISADAPFSGTFYPANPLSAFIGENPNGTWTLHVSDHAAANTGQVNAFSLVITDDSSHCDDRVQTVGGYVSTNGATGLSGVLMSQTRSFASNSYTTTISTDENGLYLFRGLPHKGNYTVKPFKLGYTFSPASRYFSVLDTPTTASFIATKTNFSISGRVVAPDGVNGLGGVTMRLTGDRTINATTGADGQYTFPNLPASGSYTITPSMIGYKFTSASLSYSNLSAHQRNQDFKAKLQNYSIGGVVRLGAARLGGVTITLSSPTPAGFPARTANTNSNGVYSFTNLPAGRSYTVTATKTGYQFTPAKSSFVNLSANQTAANFDVKVYSISGRVTKPGSTAGISSVTISLSSPSPAGFAGRTVLTNSTGNYTFTNIPAGRSYTLQPTKTGFTFTPATRSITNLHNNIPVGAATSFTGAP